MKKKILLSIMLIGISIFALGSISVLAASSGTCGDNLKWNISGNTLTISGTGDMTSWSSPSSVPWYSSRDSIENIVIGGNVTSIGDYAFYYCNKLVSATVPNSVTSIGYRAFYYCENLTSVTIGKNVTSIGRGAFYKCTNLEKINWNAKNVADFSNDNSNSNYVFSYAGQNGNGIDVVFGNSVETIPANAFYPYYDYGYDTPHSPKIVSATIGDSVKNIGEYAFKYCKSLTSVTIGKSVTSIEWDAFYWCSGLTELIIPNSVTSIGNSAFYYCENLTSVTIGENVTNIGNRAFYKCTHLEKINWNAKNVTDFSSNGIFAYVGQLGDGIEVIFGENVETIPTYAFCPTDTYKDHYPKIISVTIGGNVTSVGEYAFCACSSLKNVIIGNSVKSIGDCAFSECENLSNVIIGDSVTNIGDYAFRGCSNLTSVTIPSSVTNIGVYVFGSLETVYYNGIESAWNKITIGSRNTCLTEATRIYFAYITIYDKDENKVSVVTSEMGETVDVSKIEVPNGYVLRLLYCDKEMNEEYLLDTIISENLTLYADLVKGGVCGDNLSWILDDGILTISGTGNMDDWTWYSNVPWYSSRTSINTIVIGENVTSIGDNAFSCCNNLKSITVSERNEYFSSDSTGVLYNKDKTKLIQYPIGSSKTEFMIPSSVINIGNLAFYCCSNLKSVTIEENVSSIGYRAFYSCSKLEKINWNAKNVDDFSSSNVVFYKAGQSGNGIEVIFGDNVETIPAYVFYSSSMSDYPKIASVKIGENVKSIGKYAFYYSRSLTNIELPNSIESIGEYAFWYCSNLKNVTMGNGVTTIGNAAFGGCSSLTEITIPENVTSIGTWAFSSCSKLEKINWNAKNVDDFSSSNAVFYNAGKSSNGIEVIFGSSVETIPAYAFYPYSYSTSYSPKIVRATLGKEVTNIGEYAFYGCSSLETVHYNGTESNWNKITIGSDNTCLTDAAFTYFAYITIYDKDGNKVIDTTQNMGDYVDVSGIIVPVGYDVVLCKDQALTESYSLDMPISENLALYYNIVKLNKSSFSGTESADVGQKGITESVTFATDKTAKDFVATIKYSDKLNLSAITEKDFSITENLSETKNDYTYLYLTCTYKNDGNMPKNTTLNPFDLVFDVSESATANEKLTIEFVNGETFLADSGNNTYDFDGLGTAEIKVNPIFVKSITINGADEIDKATQYTAVISPENATNKDIEWTVDNSEIATISADGILTPVKAGTVKIKATAKDGSGIYDEKSVNVKVYAQITSLTANVGVWNKAFTPSEREYIIYVPKNTSSIKFTAQYSGTLKSETKTFYNGRPQTISLTDTETVLTLTYSETGYTDSEYKIKIVKFEGTKTTVSDNGTKFTVIPINIKGGTVILALYNGDTFVEMQSKPYNGDDTFTTDKAYTTAKVMVWDSLESMTPICDVEIVK